ncbi:MAG: hypothetical protein WBA51_15375 [Erythrobacter sp.]
MITCTSNTILTRLMLRAFVASVPVLLLAACSGEATLANADEGRAPTEGATAEAMTPAGASSAQAPRVTGAPAQPSPDGPVSETSRLISAVELSDQFPDRKVGEGCFITFAYRGYPPETLIWNKEPCSALSIAFRDRASLEQYDDWDRLNEYDKERFAALPDGEVFYVEGQFTASIYPIDYNHLTYEVVVTD